MVKVHKLLCFTRILFNSQEAIMSAIAIKAIKAIQILAITSQIHAKSSHIKPDQAKSKPSQTKPKPKSSQNPSQIQAHKPEPSPKAIEAKPSLQPSQPKPAPALGGSLGGLCGANPYECLSCGPPLEGGPEDRQPVSEQATPEPYRGDPVAITTPYRGALGTPGGKP